MNLQSGSGERNEEDIWPEPVIRTDDNPKWQPSVQMAAIMEADIDSDPDQLVELALEIAEDWEQMFALSLVAQHMVARFRVSDATDILNRLRNSDFEPEMLIEAIIHFHLSMQTFDDAQKVAKEVIQPYQRARAFIQIAEFHSNESNVELRDMALRSASGAIKDVIDNAEREHLLFKIELVLGG